MLDTYLIRFRESDARSVLLVYMYDTPISQGVVRTFSVFDTLQNCSATHRFCARTDIRDLVSVEDVMTEMQFGPNGALVFCMEYLVENLEWLQVRSEERLARHSYRNTLGDFILLLHYLCHLM